MQSVFERGRFVSFAASGMMFQGRRRGGVMSCGIRRLGGDGPSGSGVDCITVGEMRLKIEGRLV